MIHNRRLRLGVRERHVLELDNGPQLRDHELTRVWSRRDLGEESLNLFGGRARRVARVKGDI
jgi:hypothetical protein